MNVGRIRPLLLLSFLCMLLGTLGLTSAALGQAERTVLVARVDGPIFPVIAGYVDRAIADAEQRGAVALVLELDTPGGLDGSMRQINQRILASRVPVIVYVSPSGARAGSAGVYITYASHLAAMAPGTNIGSATPVQVGEGGEAEVSDEMRAKLNNDAVAYVRGLAQLRGRNADWAESAVRDAANVTAEQAVELRVIELVATDLQDLLRQADGRTVQTTAGPLQLNTAGAALERSEMTAVEALLKVITEPTIAYLLLSLGSLGLFLELSNPGSILPGVAGVICLLLGLYALGSLPVTYAGALFLALAFALFIADVLAPSHGILTVGGILSFALGSMLLINAPQGAPWLEISISAIIGATAALGGFFLFVAGSLARLRGKQPVTGREGLIGQVGEVRTPLDPKGTVFVTGELWTAVINDGPATVGQRVEVVGLNGLTLTVRPIAAPATLLKSAAEPPPPTPA